MTRPPGDPGLALVDATPNFASRAYGESVTQRLPATQGYRDTSQFYVGYPQPITQPPHASHSHPIPVTAVPALQSPAKIERNARRTRRSTRAHDPVRGQRTGRQREGGRGRTHGAPNYKPREVQVLLDLVEEELPIASKGWRVIGSQFRDWVIVAEYPARTDRSLELKYKQVCFSPFEAIV